jgi:Swiss Army Knife RNA repair-like protein
MSRTPPPRPLDPAAAAGEKPLLLIDIDGVLSLFGMDPARLPRGSFANIEGVPHFLSAEAAEHLLALLDTFDGVWCSGWEEKANEHLPHLLGLPAALPFLSFARSPGRAHAHWKLEAIDRYAADRALAWVDDAFNDACHSWAAARPVPTLLVATAPGRGLTARETARLMAWSRELGGSAGR